MEDVKPGVPSSSSTYHDESTSSSDYETSSPVRRNYDDKDVTSKPAARAKQMDVNSFADFIMHGVNKAPPIQDSPSKISSIPSFGIKDEGSSAVDYGTEQLNAKSSADKSELENIASPILLSPQTARAPSLDKAKVAPAAPRSRHGKSLPTAAVKGPQTVSFDSFAATIEDKSPRSVTESETGNFNSSFTPSISSASRTNSHSSASLRSLNLPAEHGARRLSTESRTSLSLTPSTPTDSKKSAPPPVPIARRSTVKRNRADTASSNTSQTDNTIVPSTPTESISSLQKVAAPPPPPPTRRHGSTSTIPQTSSNEIPRSQDQTAAQIISSSRARSASGSSYITAPPPPPPARRRSSRHSIDTSRQNVLAPGSGPSSRRTSTDLPRSSFDSQRWLPSELAPQSAAIEEENRVEPSALSPATPGATSEPQVDILADMEALQKEIDDLRARTQP